MNHLCITVSGSATDAVPVELLKSEGVHLVLANLAGVSYESEPRRFWETRSTILDEEDLATEILSAQCNTAQRRNSGGRPTPFELCYGTLKDCVRGCRNNDGATFFGGKPRLSADRIGAVGRWAIVGIGEDPAQVETLQEKNLGACPNF